MEIRISLRAEIVKVDPGTGLVTLAIEGVPMDHDLQKALDRAFPHCYQEIEGMIAREALIGAITQK